MPRKRLFTVMWSAIAVVFGLVVLVVLRSTPDIARIIRGFTVGERAARAVTATWRAEGFAGLPAITVTLDGARSAFVRARDTAESTPFLPFLPGARAFLGDVQALADAGVAWVDGARILAASASRGRALTDRIGARAPIEWTAGERAEVAGYVASAVGDLRRALIAIERGLLPYDRVRSGVPCPALLVRLGVGGSFCSGGRLARELIPEVARIRAFAADGRMILAAAERLLASTADGEAHRALLLFLNNTELRPGGGFLGTYGVATFQNGALVSFRTDDVYNLDRRVEGSQRIAPPAPFREHGIVPYWYLRDANWSPDFAESTRTVLDFYAREGGGPQPELIVGITPTFVAALLEVLGPVTIGGTRFDAANITDELEEQVERGYAEQGIPRPQRKAIIQPLSVAVADRILRRPLVAWHPLGMAVRTAIAERHLMAYAPDAALQRAIARFDADGAVPPIVLGGDALMVVDANLGALKTDPVVERSIRYAVTPDGDGFRGVVRLRYRNTGTFTWKTTRYRTYTRAYLPSGTTFIRATGAMARDRSDVPGRVDIGEEFGRTVFGAFLSVEPGEERTLAFEFTLTSSVAERIHAGSYTLAVQKQLGSLAPPLTLDLEFGTPVEAADPPEPPAAWGDGRYSVETDLREDRAFRVELQR